VVQNGTADFAYSLADTPASVAITITDNSGNTVATMSGPTASGMPDVSWDGTETNGTQAPDGTYSIGVQETSASGAASAVSNVYLVGTVTGVSLNGTTNTLSIGDQTLDISNVSNVYSSIEATSVAPTDSTS
jgi:flagellar basal-body rod modification protein FlgD